MFRRILWSEYFNRKTGKWNIFNEITKFREICVSKILFKNFRALVTANELYCVKYSSEFLCNRNITVFEIFTKMLSGIQKQQSTDAL